MKIIKDVFGSIFGAKNYRLSVRNKAEEYAHTLDSLIDDRDDDLAKILLPIKAFLLKIAHDKVIDNAD